MAAPFLIDEGAILVRIVFYRESSYHVLMTSYTSTIHAAHKESFIYRPSGATLNTTCRIDCLTDCMMSLVVHCCTVWYDVGDAEHRERRCMPSCS